MPYRSGLKAIQNPQGKAGGVDCVAIDLPTKHSLAPSQGGFLLVTSLHSQMGDSRDLKHWFFTEPRNDVSQ